MNDSHNKPPLIVGLTGGIGSGKSAATEHFAALGATVVDTDDIAHTLTAANGPAIDAIRAAFGDEVIDSRNALDRDTMRKRVFSDPEARNRLEDILHPMIRDRAVQACRRARTPYVILAVPLLLESGFWAQQCDRICVVDCPETLQISRVGRRSGLDEAQVRAIMAAQTNRSTRLEAADDVLDNSTTLDALRAQVETLHARYLKLARQR